MLVSQVYRKGIGEYSLPLMSSMVVFPITKTYGIEKKQEFLFGCG